MSTGTGRERGAERGGSSGAGSSGMGEWEAGSRFILYKTITLFSNRNVICFETILQQIFSGGVQI